VEELQQLNNRMIDANRQHVGATAELRFIGSEVLRVVEVVDTVNQHRFARRPEHLAEWRSSSRVSFPGNPSSDSGLVGLASQAGNAVSVALSGPWSTLGESTRPNFYQDSPCHS
jgi:hypothetical protein